MELLREEFEAWLRSKRPGQIAGVIGESCYCPISQFLKRRIRRPVSTGSVLVTFLDTGENQFLPQWAAKFVREIDDVDERSPVRVAIALEVLAEIPA